MHRELKTNGGISALNGVGRVFVLDKKGKPLMPCHPARARKLLARGRARVHKTFPFTIRLVDRIREDSVMQQVPAGHI